MHRPELQPVKEFLREPKIAVVCSQCNNECGTVVYFCRTTANHGFAHVVDNNEIFCLRWLWAAVIAAFAVVAIMLIHSSVTNLVSQSITTEFVARSEDVQAILPDIHICDTSIFNMTSLAAMGLDNTTATYLALATSDNAADPSFKNDSKKKDALKREFDNILAKGPWTLKSVIENAAIKCDEMVLGCSHAGEYYDKQDCCKKFFDPTPYVSAFGSCISTHGKAILQAYQSRDAGFVVYILPNTLHIIDFDTELIKPEFILQKGLYYAISSPAIHIGEVLHISGHFAAPFSWVSLPITKSVINDNELKNNVLAPYTCIDTNDSINIKLLTPDYDYYSQANCHLTHWQRKIQEYNCSGTFYKYGNSTPLCEPQFIMDFNFDLIPKYPTGCPIACVQHIYELSPTSADFKKELLARKYFKNVPKDDLVVLHFFYPSFQYQECISHTNTYLKWLGEVGGNLGLFLGASLISILEIFALFFRCCVKSFST